ncbi:hypothetical protein [Streptomyces sp. NPDC001717]|uniref:hypothetical protein n=1 Tax=Streptomyces sp. NPDC001717 TaxID=3364604 RepID=UPI00367AAE98
MWRIWAVWGPIALLLLATMTASAIAAFRGNGEGHPDDEEYDAARPALRRTGPAPDVPAA